MEQETFIIILMILVIGSIVNIKKQPPNPQKVSGYFHEHLRQPSIGFALFHYRYNIF